LINLKFINGFTANMNVNWVSPVKKRQIIIAGDKSSIVYDDLDNDKIKIYNTGTIDKDFNANKLGDMIAPRIDTSEALHNARKHFLDCIETRRNPITGIIEAEKIMRWIS
jgi:predicted dehydrogenase